MMLATQTPRHLGVQSVPGSAHHQGEQSPHIRQLEVQEDDEEYIDVSVPAEAEAIAEELECKVVWDSSRSKPRPQGPAEKDGAADEQGVSPSAAAALHLKDQGNLLFKRGDSAGALQCYTKAWDLAAGGGSVTSKGAAELPTAQRQLLATLQSNIAAAALGQGRHTDAVAAALRACTLRPGWLKPLHRLAEAQLAVGNFAAAVAACRSGEAQCAPNSEGHTEFTPLLDRIAVTAAAAGSLAAYDGRQLEVRSAGDDAWLGRPAPHIPALDGPLDEDTALPSDDLSTIPAAPPAALDAKPSAAAAVAAAGGALAEAGSGLSRDALAAWDYRDGGALARRQRTSFRSIKEALAAARDGDRVLLRRGVHNGMGESVVVGRRVLIQGEGALAEAVIDQRANCPTFRVTRGGVVICNVDLDQTGFREAVLVSGGAGVAPLLDGCIIKCSGDDAVNVAGAAAPLLRRCTLTAKKCGLRAYDTARPRLEGCVVENCGEQGVKAMESSAVSLTGCKIRGCCEEGVVVMGAASGTLSGCSISGNKGPGVDVSGTGHVAVTGGAISGNVGGVWLWEGSTARLDGACIEGGPAQVVLTDGGAKPTAVNCQFRGTLHATDAAWEGLLGGSNTFDDPEAPTDFPPEEGPFRFVPNRFTRKQ